MTRNAYAGCAGLSLLLSVAAAEPETDAAPCYGPGDVAGAVIGTFLATLALAAAALFIYKCYWRSRKGKHLVLVTDAENPNDQYAFDNPCFREATPVKHALQEEKTSSKVEKNRWLGWSPLHSFAVHKNEKLTSLDDSHVKDSRLRVVSLKGHDFTGLGFNICGNMRDGIFVKDVLHRGPAFESGCINSGDRIDSVCISFRNMVFEDALTILSYASPYEVQVQVENDSQSRPSTLIRSKRESNAVSSAERIRHPKYNRSQSISHLAEIAKSSSKWSGQQQALGHYASEKNRINQSLNKSEAFAGSHNDYPTLKISAASDARKESSKSSAKSAASPSKSVGGADGAQDRVGPDESKMQKFGIKVLPINANPKMGIQSVTGGKKARGEEGEKQKSVAPPPDSPEDGTAKTDETDGNNVKTFISKGLHNLKEKINQNSLGRKKKEDQGDEGASPAKDGAPAVDEEKPVPKVRSAVPTPEVPEEVTRAGDVARSNRRQAERAPEVAEAQKESEAQKAEDNSGSDTSSEGGSAKRPKRSKGKAPAPPPTGAKIDSEIDAIANESEMPRDEKSIFEPAMVDAADAPETKPERSYVEAYDSDSDDMREGPAGDGTKIELSATQVTVHHGPTSDAGNDDEIETNRKAASLGDLSRLDSEHALSVVLERAVSLDLADGTGGQCGKKRKAPLPPPEEFPAVFDEIGYRKEPRLETSLGVNTFQRRLKKSSDFGTLEDALHDGPKSLEIEVKKQGPSLDVLEANNSNIQEFSSWLAECRKHKDKGEEREEEDDRKDAAEDEKEDVSVKAPSRSLVNVNMTDTEAVAEDYAPQTNNVTFSVNGQNVEEESGGPNSYTVLVISQPNSLEPIISEGAVSMNVDKYGGESVAQEQDSKMSSEGFNVGMSADSSRGSEEVPPELPTSPIPVISKTTLSTPLSKSLTYVTEIKVSTSDEEAGPSSAEESRDENIVLNISSGNGRASPGPRGDAPSESNSFASLISKFSPKEEITVNNESVVCDSSRRGSDYGYETSKIPIRTMKSETGQKVLATIQSLAAKESPPKTPEMEYAKRVASLFFAPGATPKPAAPRQVKSENDNPSFYLGPSPKKPAPNRKTPPTVPPRKTDTTLASAKSTVTVGPASGKGAAGIAKDKMVANDSPTDRNIVTFSSFIPRSTGDERDGVPKIVNWKESMKEIGEINGGHMQVQSGMVNLPVKTSATKIVFETKDMDKGEL